jgi:hypothetical protein
MRTSLRISLGILALGGVGLFALVSSRTSTDRAHAAPATPIVAAAPARLGVLYGPVDGETTTVGFATIDATGNGKLDAVGWLTHPPGSARRGAVMLDREVAFVVVAEPGDRRSSYANALYRVEKGTSTRLCGGIAKAATPIVTSTGRVIVARGADGPEPTDVESKQLLLRVDTLTIDDVDPASGNITTLWTGSGYQAFLGARVVSGGREEIVVSLAGRTGTSLVALDPATKSVRVLAPSVPPWARDFSFDPTHGALVFADLVKPYDPTWNVLSLDLASLAIRPLYTTKNEHPMPFALPSGEIAISSDDDHGLALVVSDKGQRNLLAPLGDGSDGATHASADGRWVAVRHTPVAQTNDDPPKVVAFDPVTSTLVPLALSARDEITPIGFVGGAP